ncbi:MAG: helix-turn-helix transcriptional regulator [Lentisphaeria bacterium]|nr:helix-turn-helix transcriptional regulator [Lentisphaeria bacterium]
MEKLVNINDTDWWQENKHRVLAGARLKAGLTQKQLADKTGIRQSVISEYENGKRRMTMKMARKFASALHTFPEKFMV